jgi:hypothetical protein
MSTAPGGDAMSARFRRDADVAALKRAEVPRPVAWRIHPADAAQFAAERKHCEGRRGTRRCREAIAVVTWRWFRSAAAGRVIVAERFVCIEHGQEFAGRHGIELGAAACGEGHAVSPRRREPRGRHEPMIITIRVPGAKVALAKADVATILQALGDAEGWRRRRVDQWCSRCENAPQGRSASICAPSRRTRPSREASRERPDRSPRPGPELGPRPGRTARHQAAWHRGPGHAAPAPRREAVPRLPDCGNRSSRLPPGRGRDGHGKCNQPRGT